MRNNLINFRKMLGFNQTEMAKLFNLSKSVWSGVEHARLKGTAEMWIDLGVKFDLTAKELQHLKEVS